MSDPYRLDPNRSDPLRDPDLNAMYPDVAPPRRGGGTWAAILVVVILLIAGFMYLTPRNPDIAQNPNGTISSPSSPVTPGTATNPNAPSTTGSAPTR